MTPHRQLHSVEPIIFVQGRPTPLRHPPGQSTCWALVVVYHVASCQIPQIVVHHLKPNLWVRVLKRQASGKGSTFGSSPSPSVGCWPSSGSRATPIHSSHVSLPTL